MKPKPNVSPPKIGKARRATLKGNQSKAYVATKDGGVKFIGGAAMARRKATMKTKGNRILRPGEKETQQRGLPPGLSPFERFFAGVLRSETNEFMGKPREVWTTICKRMNLPTPSKPLAASYDNQKVHFAYRAALVLEEARYSVSAGLVSMQKRLEVEGNRKNSQRNKQNGHRRGGNSNSMIMTLAAAEFKEKTGHSSLCFEKGKKSPFTPDEIANLRQGTVFACLNRSLAANVANMYLGVIIPASRDEMIKSHSFSVMIFRQISATPNTKWELTPITSLLSEQRKFEACTSTAIASVPFLFPLLGAKESTHTRFVDDEGGNPVAVEAIKSDPFEDAETTSDYEMSGAFRLKKLNRSQEKAASAFLRSEPNTITLVQGPPGTGKTTLLVSVICRYIMQSIEEGHGRTLMVCAPTNKAVAVLCTRFLNTMADERPCNIVLVGDDDKLLDDDNGRSGNGVAYSPMRSVFLYTWISTVLDDYQHLKNQLSRKGRKKFDDLAKLARRNQTRVQRGLENSKAVLSPTMLEAMDGITKGLRLGESAHNDATIRRILEYIEQVIAIVRDWRNDDIWRHLLGSAHVVFCTLASAGTGIIKKSIVQVSDLIVDEAAAATEPEMYIPFTFRPQRLLAVGDPKQLPATVVSHIAEELGMSKSLHERLMFDCGHKHIMLDLQYRMKPELSKFPREIFYGGKLSNGSNVSRPDYQGDVQVLRGQQYSLWHVNGTERQAHSGSFENHSEAQAVVDMIQKIKQASRGTPGRWNSVDRVRVITFYQGQVSLIKRLLHKRRLGDIVVATVDSSQGCEADIVVVSFVRSHGVSGRQSVGFLSDDRRMNVALTRAKYQMVCIGNFERMLVLEDPKAGTVKSLVEDAQQRNCIIGNMSRRVDTDTNNPRPEKKNEPARKKRKEGTVGPEEGDGNLKVAATSAGNAHASKKRILNDRSPANASMQHIHETAGRKANTKSQPRNISTLKNEDMVPKSVDSRSLAVSAADSTVFVSGYHESTGIKAGNNQGAAVGKIATVDNPPADAGEEKLGLPKYECDSTQVPSYDSNDDYAGYDSADPSVSNAPLGNTNDCTNDQESNDESAKVHVTSVDLNGQNINIKKTEAPFPPAPTATAMLTRLELLLADSDDSSVGSDRADRPDGLAFVDSRTAIHQPRDATLQEENKPASQAQANDEVKKPSVVDIFRSPTRKHVHESCSEDESNEPVVSNIFRPPGCRSGSRADDDVATNKEPVEKDPGMFTMVDI